MEVDPRVPGDQTSGPKKLQRFFFLIVLSSLMHKQNTFNTI